MVEQLITQISLLSWDDIIKIIMSSYGILFLRLWWVWLLMFSLPVVMCFYNKKNRSKSSWQRKTKL